jgi:sugar diacid utilization regulator
MPTALPALRPAAAREHNQDEFSRPPRNIQDAMTDAVLTGSGLGLVVDLMAAATDQPVAVVIPRLGGAFAAGDVAADHVGALEDWVEDELRGHSPELPHCVELHIPIRFRHEVVGCVALLSGEQPAADDAYHHLHAAWVAALMQLAMHEAKEATEQQLRGSFIEELRSSEQLSRDETIRRARRLGCEIAHGATALCASVTDDRSHLVTARIIAAYPGALVQQLDLGDGDPRPRIYALLPGVAGAEANRDSARAAAQQLAQRLQRYATVGLSSFQPDPGQLSQAVQEAELVLDVLRHSGGPISEEIGSVTYKLLFRVLASHPEEIHRFYESTVAALVTYDDQYGTDLVRTLQSYLDANCNMNTTAAAVFAHRHTVAYRLERVRELTGLDPALSEHRERLGLGLKILRLVPVRPTDLT